MTRHLQATHQSAQLTMSGASLHITCLLSLEDNAWIPLLRLVRLLFVGNERMCRADFGFVATTTTTESRGGAAVKVLASVKLASLNFSFTC
jgi:hypothetical protein